MGSHIGEVRELSLADFAQDFLRKAGTPLDAWLIGQVQYGGRSRVEPDWLERLVHEYQTKIRSFLSRLRSMPYRVLYPDCHGVFSFAIVDAHRDRMEQYLGPAKVP